MTLPSWQNPALGAKVRAALWLEAEVGENGIFTKAQLRQAFPENTQIDRRVRELRDHGWRIDTSRDDVSLKQEEQKYVAKGAEIWIPGQGSLPKHKSGISQAQRAKVLSGDDFLCRTCGVGVAEAYVDGPGESKQLGVARREVVQPNGEVVYQLETACSRCITSASDALDLNEILAAVGALSPMEKNVLAVWIAEDRRTRGSLEILWGRYRTLPAEARQAIVDAVADSDQ
ncbi:hypothetical protein [Streptomyces sp. H34-S4]|uniref:hypothetical protein n=1 Tax=Streptomyces sp. H34-S4 TaxID=2996463 RepID=UPI0022705981|nr:hypothetical protein [Streptomyces sp. H34-S4]MCY0934753.1 hypothetical protein [Streptomyces sp. H34-S4]